MNKKLIILNKNNASSILQRMRENNKICYCLSDDNAYFIGLRDKFANNIEINNLSGMFDKVLQEIKEPYLELMAQINKKFDSLEWWGSMIASKNSESTPLLKNIVYLFCARRILTDSVNHIIFIVDSQALAQCISRVAVNSGYQVKNVRNMFNRYLIITKIWVNRSIQFTYFFIMALQNHLFAFKYLNPLTAKKPPHCKKRIIIRSWITKGNFDNHKRFKDRNFGLLSDWLKSKNYEVWILPMFFNISIKYAYTLLCIQKQNFLLPYHYLNISDYFRTLLSSLKMINIRVNSVKIFNVNVAPILNEDIKMSGFSGSLSLLNLCYQMLKRLQEKGFQIDGFYYAFEGNPSEKQFILGCRRYFPNSKIIGYQHTTFFPNQLAYHFSKEEINFHPFPDKIICKGPIYIDLFKKAGFDPNILFAGPNLRFDNVWIKRKESNNYLSYEKKNLIIVLPSKAVINKIIFSFLEKIRKSVYNEEYNLYIRTHPDFSMSTMDRYLNNAGIFQYIDASDHSIQYWLQSMYAGIIPGISITVLELASMGVPVIQVIPENTIFYNPFNWSDYPLSQVRTDVEIMQQLDTIRHHLMIDRDHYVKLSVDIKNAYFTKPNNENLNIFL